ncbi:MAG: hypothetical protein GKR93_11280 [Gammaproteobacteria bacterium]|nr:hypothetical protein [Gammaproteobacteria bacterium]
MMIFRSLYKLITTSVIIAGLFATELVFAHDLPGADFAGVWEHMGNFRKFKNDPVFTPEAQIFIDKQTELRDKGDYSGDNSANCIPPSLPTMITIGAQELLVDKKKITWIMESIGGIRWIWLDGRSPVDLNEVRPAAFGHSVGHWEGDTLVVESIGFLDKSNLYGNRPNNESVFPGPKMHVVERLHLEDNSKVMVNQRTITDPKNFAKPWTTTSRYERRPDWELEEAICAENNLTEEYE